MGVRCAKRTFGGKMGEVFRLLVIGGLFVLIGGHGRWL